MGDRLKKPQAKNSGEFSFFQRFLALLSGTNEPEREKRRRLKQLASDLSHMKFKFYKPRTGEALGGLAKFFFEVYRVVGPAQPLVQGGENSNALKEILIESYLSDRQKTALERVSEESIRAAAKSMRRDKLVAEVKDALGEYVAGFDASVIRRIDATYTLIQQLIAFIRFDYYFVLRKFDSGILEGVYTHPPRVESINAAYVVDDLKDFLEVLLPLEHDADWDPALAVLKQYREVDVIPAGPWKKLLSSLSSVARSGVLVKIIQHVDEDPSYAPLVNSERYRIVEMHLSALKTRIEALMQKLIREFRDQKIKDAASTVFGSEVIQRIRNYTQEANASFSRRMISGFTHTEAINYLAVFLLDYFSGEVRGLLSDVFIVRAQWSDSITSGQFSEAFYTTLKIAERVEQFDQSVGEGGEWGAKIRKASGTGKSVDGATTRMLRQLVHDIDEQAMALIAEAGGQLVAVGRTLKLLIEDMERRAPEVIMNWRELTSLSEQPLKDQLVAIYKKIYYFIQLLQFFVKKA